ncbi:MAG: hypothetical protein KGI06_06015 [Candidatus Micrarchaeota archaeon]|nr:hypothetical protein [Candidatus Micrarchaeota archaeon]
MRTKDKLAQALEEVGAPSGMIEAALNGSYDDFESNSATPINDLIRDASKHSLSTIVGRAMNGDFDATREEARAWFNRKGKNLIGGHNA